MKNYTDYYNKINNKVYVVKTINSQSSTYHCMIINANEMVDYGTAEL